MKPTARMAISGLLIGCLTTPVLPARAEIIGAKASDHERIAAVLARDDVRAQLASRGVEAAQVDARLAALTDAEAAQLARDIDALPAGGNPGAAIGAAAMVVVYAIALVVVGVVAIIKHAATRSAKSGSAE